MKPTTQLSPLALLLALYMLQLHETQAQRTISKSRILITATTDPEPAEPTAFTDEIIDGADDDADAAGTAANDEGGEDLQSAAAVAARDVGLESARDGEDGDEDEEGGRDAAVVVHAAIEEAEVPVPVSPSSGGDKQANVAVGAVRI